MHRLQRLEQALQVCSATSALRQEVSSRQVGLAGITSPDDSETLTNVQYYHLHFHFVYMASFSTHLFRKDWFAAAFHYELLQCIPFHCWCQPSPSNKAVAFDLQNPWVKQYGVTNSQSAIRGLISDEVTQTASQPYNWSILISFQIQSRVVIYWWLKREKPFVSEQIYFSLKLRPFDLNFISSAAAKMKLLKAKMMQSNVFFGLGKIL